MKDRPKILAFDTSGPWCAVALGVEDVMVAGSTDDMTRGQAEALMPKLSSLLEAQGASWMDLEAIGVGIGPGNFTGIRISVSAARGLSLALGIPAIGVSAFDLMRDPDGLGAAPAQLVTVPAPRDQVYGQFFRYGTPDGAPMLIDPEKPGENLRRINLEVRGHRAREIAAHYEAAGEEASLDDLPRRLIKMTDYRLRSSEPSPPAPLYVRPADAAPASDPPPVILS